MTSFTTELNCEGLDEKLDNDPIWLLNAPSVTADLSWKGISECNDTLDEDPDKESIWVVLIFLPNAELKFRGELTCVVIVSFTTDLNCEDLGDSICSPNDATVTGSVLMVTTFSFGSKLNLRDDDEITCRLDERLVDAVL